MPHSLHFLHIMLCFLQCCLSFIKDKLHLKSLMVTSVQDSKSVQVRRKKVTLIFLPNTYLHTQVFLLIVIKRPTQS